MFEDQPDPNPEREDPPFPTQNGPPRFQQPACQPQHQQAGNPAQQAPNGNGHGVTYQQPPQQGYSPPPFANVPQPMRQAMAHQEGPPSMSELAGRVHMLHVGLRAGAIDLAALWAEQLAMFRREYQRQTGNLITDREAFDIVTMPLVMAMD